MHRQAQQNTYTPIDRQSPLCYHFIFLWYSIHITALFWEHMESINNMNKRFDHYDDCFQETWEFSCIEHPYRCSQHHECGDLRTFPWLPLQPFKPGNWRAFISFTGIKLINLGCHTGTFSYKRCPQSARWDMQDSTVCSCLRTGRKLALSGRRARVSDPRGHTLSELSTSLSQIMSGSSHCWFCLLGFLYWRYR